MSYDASKPSLEDLAHFGVPGMKWGHRKTNPSSSDIREARRRQEARAVEIHKLDKKAARSNSPQERVGLQRQSNKVVKDIVTNEDAITATHMTRGEKTVSVILGGPLGLLSIANNKAEVRAKRKQVEDARKRA